MNVYFARAHDRAFIDEWIRSAGLEKRSRIDRLYRPKDRVLAATAHRLLCYALNKELGIAPQPFDWDVGQYGKPCLKDKRVHFNVSHSGDIAMCALHDKPVGVDIEKLRDVDENVALRIMSREEYKAYKEAFDKQRFFYQVWTLKESYLKCRGTGLTDALKELTICPKDDHIHSNVRGCKFIRVDNIPEYQAAICTKEYALSKIRWIEAEELMLF